MSIERRYALIGHEHAGAGVTDHGALTGLADNDHPQYLLAADAVTDHGALTGLSDDDHPQYAALAQNEQITGNWTFGEDDGDGSGHVWLKGGATVGYGWLGCYNTQDGSGVSWWFYNENWTSQGYQDNAWAIGVLDSIGNASYGATFRTALAQWATPPYTFKDIFSATQDTPDVVSDITIGNSTDLPTTTVWAGTNVKISLYGTIDRQEAWFDGGDGYMGLTILSDRDSDGVTSGYGWLETQTWGKSAAAVATQATLWLSHNRGTYASPAASQAGDEVGEIVFNGRCSTPAQVGVPGSIRAVVDTVNAANVSGSLVFLTHPGSGSWYSGQVERMRLYSTGEIGFGTDGWLTFDEHSSAPGTPSSGRVALYAKADGKLYIKDDAGTETDLASGGGGAVATDAIWDAKGDLAVGTGANTASKLSVGSDHLALVSDSAEATGTKWGSIGIPQNAQTGNYTVALSDNGKHIYHASGDGAGDVYTIPANASVALPVGFTVTFVNMSADTVSIAITTDTMYLAGFGSTGTRTLAQYGVATAIKLTATTWVISGAGLS